MPHTTEAEEKCSAKQILQDFKEVIKGIQNFNCPMDDEFLVKFLAARKYRLNESVKLLKRYFELRRKNFQLLMCVCPLNLQDMWNIDRQTIVLKHRDAFGRKIVVLRNGLWKADLMPYEQVLMVKYYILEEVISCPETQNNGIVIISDDTGIGFDLASRYLYELSYSRIRLILNVLQGGYPCLLKAFHVVHCSSVFGIIFNITRTFLSSKLRKRFLIHGSKIQNLHKHISPDILPTFLGGKLNLEDACDSQLMDNLFNKGAYYKKMTEFGYTDSNFH